MLLGRITYPDSHIGPPGPLRTNPCWFAITSAIVFLVVLGAAFSSFRGSLARNENKRTTFQRARLSEHLTVRQRARGDVDAALSLKDGRDLITSYEGPAPLQRALAQNEAQPRSLAAADFDEDGVPDLVSGYTHAGRGIVTIHRGNVDSIYPNAPEAQRRKANQTFTSAPFLSPAVAIEVKVSADFLGVGDFDADGHWDLVLASRGGKSLHFLPGDGKGKLRRGTGSFRRR